GILFLVVLVGSVVAGVWSGLSESGFISHTERVITDMNPQWLNGELNSCFYLRLSSSADEVATLTCGTGDKTRHITVRFYGITHTDDKTTKTVTTEWKCVRDGDAFSCSDGKSLSVR